MARAPFQVLVIPHRIHMHNQLEFALLKRADEGFWQGIAGGGEGEIDTSEIQIILFRF
jgi:dATP pyrophosphohydrolase